MVICPSCGTPEIGGLCATKRRQARRDAEIEYVLTVVAEGLGVALGELMADPTRSPDTLPPVVLLANASLN